MSQDLKNWFKAGREGGSAPSGSGNEEQNKAFHAGRVAAAVARRDAGDAGGGKKKKR